MNAQAFNIGNGWVVGGLCWLILRLLARMDDIQKEQAEARRQMDEIRRLFGALEKEKN